MKYDLTNEEIISAIYFPTDVKSRDVFLKYALWCILDLHKNYLPDGLDIIRQEYGIDESVDFETEFELANNPISAYNNSIGETRFRLCFTMRLKFANGMIASYDEGDIGFEHWCNIDNDTEYSYILSLAKVPYQIDYVSPFSDDSTDRIIDRYLEFKAANKVVKN